MKTLIFSILVLLMATSCKSKKGTSASEKLANGSWQVELLENTKPKSTQTFIIEDSKIKGKAACNGYGGKIELKEKNGITISDVMGTKMACANLAEETLYFSKLRNVTNYKIIKGELFFYNNENKQLVKFIKLK